MVAKEEISSGERTEYEWDHRNRLVRIVSKDEFDAVTKVVEQTYDHQNRWVRSQIDADGDEDFDSERFFAYDGNQIVLEFAGDAASDLSHRYLWGPAVDQILADESVASLTSAGDILWPLTDHLNTTRDLAEYNSGTDTASIASHRVFDSFGNLISETNGSVTILFGFTARPFDVASGLQWNLNRWYISTLGVWMSEDPIGFEGNTANLRQYVHSSPLVFVDSTGLAADRASSSLTVLMNSFYWKFKVGGTEYGSELSVGEDKKFCNNGFKTKPGITFTDNQIVFRIGVEAKLGYDLKGIKETERANYYWHQEKNRGRGWEPDGPERFIDQKIMGSVLFLNDTPGIEITVPTDFKVESVGDTEIINFCFDTNVQDEINTALKPRLGKEKQVEDIRDYRSILKKKDGTVIGYFEWGLTITLALDDSGRIVPSVEKRDPVWHDGVPK
jgi:RHS repeat-associated protein